MDQKNNGPATSNNPAKNVRDAAGRMSCAFSHASALGFAILDGQLRYQAINDALIAINGIPALAHMGNTIRDVFGNPIADQIEAHVHRMLATGNPSLFEMNATLPTRSEPGSWIVQYFAINGAARNHIGIGLVVVEVTQLRKLDGFLEKFTRCLLREQTRDNWWLARELHDAIDQYHFALGASIDRLTRTVGRDPELSVATVQSLDQRILEMRKLVALVESRFPVSEF
jgi:hypothetical protein